MCVLDNLKEGIQKHKVNDIKAAVTILRFNGYGYGKIFDIAHRMTGIEEGEFEVLMQEIDEVF